MRVALIGFFAGAVSGVVMAFISHAFFRLKVFKSSLILIDGSFFLRTLRLPDNPSLTYGAGIIIHLVTSGVFGTVYVTAAYVLGFDVLSFPLVCLYVLLLLFSMLFIALPVAGEGMLGRKSDTFGWLQQLILHIVFCVLYYVGLKTLL